MDYVKKLVGKFPACSPYLTELKRLQAEVDRILIAAFFEPKVLLVAKGKEPTELLQLDAATLVVGLRTSRPAPAFGCGH